ncbi:cell division protein SepF [uncultured Cetobacterium sp.]|uniref:cell division protein SepF n=1 Tax=uncultured Cetobacterium sp. TaxID=527638 RepID=UPI0026372A31|nr:cell division protein SepF [uncultured Cetobacterium sp.]
MKIAKFKNVIKDFTDSVGLTFDPEENGYDDIDSLDSQESNISKNNVIQDEPSPIAHQKYETRTAAPAPVDPKDDDSCQTIFVNPKGFSECKKIADYIKKDKVVTLNLENVSAKDAQRILDFLSGSISVKEAKWIPISKNVFTSVPKNINFLYDGKNELKQKTFQDIDHD